MDTIPPSTRRANRLLLVALMVFAVTLAVVCFLWMRGVVRNDGGIADPQPRKTSMSRRTPAVPADFTLPTAQLCLT